jgi:glutamate-1-semialdehyde 2,1-aminomutase
MSSSSDLFARAQQLIPGGVNSPVRAFRSVGGAPFFTKSAQGAILTTADGKELIDFVCTWGPAIHGHNHPRIKAAIAAALDQGTSFGTPNPYEVEMAELIVDFFPSIQKVRMCSSGTEATMSAIRLARGFTKRDKIIKFAGCYHGHSDSLLVAAGSGALTHGNPDSAGVPAAFARETVVLPYNDTSALDAAFAANPGQIACVILEPYIGNVGFIKPDAGYLQHVRRATAANGTLLIFDEVMTGFRISRGGVQELESRQIYARQSAGRASRPDEPRVAHGSSGGFALPSTEALHPAITPDLTCLGKIIGGGLPVGAFGGRADIMDYLAPLGPVYQAGTLSGNPLAMAAGIAQLRLLDEVKPYARLDALGRQVVTAAAAAAKTKGIPLQAPQAGSMFSLFFTPTVVRDMPTALTSDAKLFGRFFHACLADGVYLPPSAYESWFLSTAHEGPAIARACEIITKAIKSL